MIAKVAISPNGLRQTAAPADDAAEATHRHEQLLRALIDHGVLVFGRANDKKGFQRALKDLRASCPDAFPRWIETIKYLQDRRRVRGCEPPAGSELDALVDRAGLRSGWSTRTRVAVVPPALAAALGVPPGVASAIDPVAEVDVAVAAKAADCATFRHFRDLVRDHVLDCGASRETFWEDVLGPILREANTVTILDRFMFSGGVPAVGWILQHLDAEGRVSGVRVTLMGETGRDGLPADAAAASRDVLSVWIPNGRVEAVDIIGGTWSDGTKALPHDRHISSNLGVGVEIPAGLDRFAMADIRDPEGVSWSYSSTPKAFSKLHHAAERVRQAPGRSTASVHPPA